MKIILYKSILYTVSMLIFILLSEKIFNFKNINKYVSDQETGKLEEPWYHKSLRYFMITIEQNLPEYFISNISCSLIGGILSKNFKIPQLLIFNYAFYVLITFFILNFISKIYFERAIKNRTEPTDPPDSPDYIDPNDGDEEEGEDVNLETKLNSSNIFSQKGLFSIMSINNYPITILLVFVFAFSSDIFIKILSNIFKLEASE